MADTKLSDLTALPSALAATDLVYVVRGAAEYKATGNQLPSGDVVGPASATDAVPALFDGTTGKLLKNSTPTGTGNPVLATSPTLTTPNIGTPSAGTLTSCTGLPVSTGISGLGTGVATFLATPSSANLASAVTDETGTGALVFANTPTLVTPALGVATATSINKVAVTAPATSATITLADGSTLATSGAFSTTLTATGATNVTLPTTGTLATLAGAESLTNKKLGSLTSDGFVKTSGGDGTLSVDTTTYTNAAVVPSTAPSAGQMLVGNAGGTAYAPVAMSGDATLASTGALTVANSAVTNAKLAASAKTGSIQFGKSNNGSALSTGTLDFAPQIPTGATLTAFSISVDTGTATVKFWKKATGTAIPTVADVINTSGVSISTGTHVRSTTMTDFTTTSVSANDIFRCDLTAVSSATWINVQLEYTRT